MQAKRAKRKESETENQLDGRLRVAVPPEEPAAPSAVQIQPKALLANESAWRDYPMEELQCLNFLWGKTF